MKKKTNQHYVWQHYLKPWTENSQIYCLRNGKVFKTNTKNIGNERDFYRLKDLSEKDKLFLERLINQYPEHLKQIHTNWFYIFTEIFNLKEKIGDSNNEKIDELLDVAINNIEEELHGKIEANAIKYIEDLAKDNVEFYNNEDDRMFFLQFLSLQYFRTKKMKESVIRNHPGSDHYDIENIWNILSHILATNSAWSMIDWSPTYDLNLISNKSILPFITGDQPIINTYSLINRNGKPVENLRFYYPITPKCAITISNKKIDKLDFNQVIDNPREIEELNKMVFEAHHEQLYADNAELLNYYSSLK